ncbi:hypothetical protein [Thalassospira marina]|uniref:Uncharacterized protein n=1 Tax=Thalassospira marina TaxID=2048283 RepID=A0ABN5FKM8_9PROT|nr:hypothetical protein [Thalassospira marina]AUG53917.1 hypothetical protein CSC3H3_15230 [Thalassospira marina]
MSGSWYDDARAVIAELHVALPADLPFPERVKAVREAYPYGERRRWPYKAWCRAQREYLSRFVTTKQRPKNLPLKPLEQFIETSTKSEKPGGTNDQA